MARPVRNVALRDRVTEIQARLATGLGKIDPHHHLLGRPVTYRVIAGQAFQITYRDVTRIDEADLLGVKKLIGDHCFSTITPQTAETLTVRFVVPLKS